MSGQRLVRFRYLPRLEKLEARDVPSFLPPQFYSIPNGSPREPLIADFNGDGRRDVAVAMYSPSGKVIVYLGDGTGNLSTPYSTYPTGYRPYSIRGGDLNKDGKLDLVTGNEGDTVSVLLGHGDGTFALSVEYPVGNTPLSVAVGDLNGDGNPDVASANTEASTACVLFGNGDGSLQPAIFYPVGELPVMAQISDLDGDGLGDLSVSSYYGDDVKIFLSSGLTQRYFLGHGTRGHSTADLNKDGYLDLVLMQAGSHEVAVMLNRTDGSFKAPVSYPAFTDMSYTSVADFNRDRKADVAVFGPHRGEFLIFLGNGDGTLQPSTLFGTGFGDFSEHLGIGDLNNDRQPDVVTTGGSGINGTSGINVLVNDKVWVPPIPPSGPGREIGNLIHHANVEVIARRIDALIADQMMEEVASPVESSVPVFRLFMQKAMDTTSPFAVIENVLE